MSPKHFIVLFLLGFVNFSLGKECLGCPKDLNANDLGVRNFLNKKLQALKDVVPEGLSDERELELVRINKAQEQVVAGILYSYQFEAKGVKTKQMYDCNLDVLVQAWLGKEEVSKYSCELLVSNSNRRPLPGGEFFIDTQHNKQLEELKSFISQEIEKLQHSDYLMTVVEYLKATMQVVEGTIIRTTVQLGVTNCPLDANSADTDCKNKLQGHQVCDIQVWLKPWMNFKEVMAVKCQPFQPLMGACAGCPFEKDPNSPLIRKYLAKTLFKLNAESQTSQKLTLVKINKATSQVINGFKLTIYFDAKDANSNKNYTCKTVIILPSSSEEPIVDDFNCDLFTAN